MRRAVLLTATAVLLLTPTVLAFFSGGYFDEPRLIATLTVWSVVLLVAVAGPRPVEAQPGDAVAWLKLDDRRCGHQSPFGRRP